MSDSETHLAAGHIIVLLRQRRGLNISICVGERLLVGAPLRIAWVRNQPVAPLPVDHTLHFLGPFGVHGSSSCEEPGTLFLVRLF